MAGVGSGQSLKAQRARVLVSTLTKSEQLGSALLIFFGALFLLLVFPFYHLALIPFLALAAGLLGYKYPNFGVLLGMVLALPAMAYQAPIFAWLFTILISLTLFEMFKFWSIIAALEILICAPFAPFPFNLLSGIVYLLMPMAVLYVGSRDSVLISLPSVLLVLLLSTIWLTPNAAFFPVLDPLNTYGPALDALQRDLKPVPNLLGLGGEIPAAIASMFSMQHIQYINPAFGKVAENTLLLFTRDSALLQLLIWGLVLYAIALISGIVKGKRKQLISGLPLLVIPLSDFALSIIYGYNFSPFLVIYIILAIVALGVLEQFNISIARERTIKREEKGKKFGKFGLQDLSDSKGEDSLEDLGGYEDVKKELLKSIALPLQQKELAYTYGIKPPNGILLFGPPGTGKTMLMRALAKELEFGFYYVKSSELLSQWYGETEKNISELFAIARKNAPCVLFFDEIDSIGKRRDAYTSDDVGPRIMSLFLEELDGFKEGKNVIIIGATNIPNQLDPALMRPGRFDKVIYMPLPDKKAREAIFRVHLKKAPVSEDVDFVKLAAKTERFSGADIKNVCTEAIGLTASEALAADKVLPVRMEHFTQVLASVKPSVSLRDLENYDQFKLDFERRVETKEVEKVESVGWDDVAGLPGVRQALKEAIEIPLLHEDLMKQYKIKPSKGLLLFGPPGCGKTLIVKAAASELKVTFLTISGADLQKKGFENAVSIMKDTFYRAREQVPSIIFIDEIDSVASSRDIMKESVVAQLLVELDGVKELKNVMFIGATNKPWELDPAMMRPGRFDRILYIPPPDAEAREQIFGLNLAGIKSEVDFAELARITERYSGADIAGACQEMKMTLVRQSIGGAQQPVLTMQVAKQVLGRRKPSISPEQLQRFEQFAKMFEKGTKSY